MHQSASVLLNRLLARGRFRQVQVLLKVAELGSLQRAAAAVGMTQSSVTQIVSHLEQMLEQRLFDRHARGMRPTAACQDLLPVARQVLVGLSAGADAVAARQQRGQSVVRIAASLAATHGLLVDTLPGFTRRVPTVTVHLTEVEGDDQLLAITRGEVDLVACRRPQVIPEDWLFHPLLQDRFAVVCHPTHPLAKRKTVNWVDLASQVWIVAPAGVTSRQSFDAVAASFPQIPRTYPIITRSPAMVRWLLRYENVLAYLPFNYVRPLIEACELAEIKVRPRVDIEALGLLRPREGLSEAAERLAAYLQRRFSAASTSTAERPAPTRRIPR